MKICCVPCKKFKLYVDVSVVFIKSLVSIPPGPLTVCIPIKHYTATENYGIYYLHGSAHKKALKLTKRLPGRVFQPDAARIYSCDLQCNLVLSQISSSSRLHIPLWALYRKSETQLLSIE